MKQRNYGGSCTCSECGRTFGGLRGFDAHRINTTGKPGYDSEYDWRCATDPELEARPADLARNKTFGVMIRASSSNQAAVSIQYVEIDAAFSDMLYMPEGGFVQVCSSVKSNGGYHCTFSSSRATSHMFWIKPETGEVRWLDAKNTVQTFTNIQSNYRVRLTEGQPNVEYVLK